MLSSERKSINNMSQAIRTLQEAQQRALAGRPKIGGFPYLAETLRRAGVTRNIWVLPACQSLYFTDKSTILTQDQPLLSGMTEVPSFNQEALVQALRTDQAGKSSFLEFLRASWMAGVIRYEVDFLSRTVTYYGCCDKVYVESYPEVEVP